MRNLSRWLWVFISVVASGLLGACGGGGGAAPIPAPPPVSVGGTISGLVGSVVLQNNGGDNLTVTANGNFTFATKLSNSAIYSVSVLTQPSGQTCSLSSNTGTVIGGNVTNVTATCVSSATTYSVGGTLTGLSAGNSIVLTDNGGDNLTVTANGSFTFATKLINGAAYSVSVLTQPSGQTCSLSSNTGTVIGGNVTNVTATCASSATTYSVDGTLTGLSAGNSIILTNNGGDNLTITANGTFTFATQLANGAAYNLTLAATTPVTQLCTSTYGAGVINAANASSLNVICGLAGGLSTFTATTGSMTIWRMAHTATLLPNGKVLVCGGQGQSFNILASAELYDPSTGKWTATRSMVTARTSHTATLLPNGKVLVSGGSNLGVLASAELYDPTTEIWTATGALSTGRDLHTATLLSNGKVLVSGGMSSTGFLGRAEVYDPATETWTSVGSLVTPRQLHTATLLPNGNVLVSGGFDAGNAAIANAELYDPVTKSWTATGPLVAARYTHTATLLPNGKVLVSGGAVGNNIVGGATGTTTAIVGAELYDPATGIWTASDSLLQARYSHTATLLPSGLVLVSGGWGPAPALTIPIASAELYDPATGKWTATGSMVTTGNSHAATLLPNGKVLVSGGSGAGYGTWVGIAEEYF